METRNEHHSGNAFLWGLIIGALLATLLTTKRGRQILRELTDLGLELFEDFVEERTSLDRTRDKKPKASEGDGKKKEDVENLEKVKEDIEAEITEAEAKEAEEPVVVEKNGNGSRHKRRLFKGIRRK